MRSIIGGATSGSCIPVKLRRFHVVGSSFSSGDKGRASSMAVGKRWREFQGCNNWDGLLDPLDDGLRSEILRYGDFVQAAYTCFDFDPSSPSYGSCLYPKSSLLRRSGLPETGYRISSNLTATSGVRLPSLASAAPAWLSRRSSWIGYVAVCEDEDEIRRLGRQDIVIAYRGTATCLEWLENLQAQLTHLPSAVMPTAKSDAQQEAMVERGFWSLFTSPCSAAGQSLRDEVRQEVQRLVNACGSNNGKPISITITGHSLGAALAVLTAYDIAMTSFKDGNTPPPMVTVVTFGGPRVGNASFRWKLEGLGIKVLRIVNAHDIVTKVPGFVEEESLPPSKWLLSKTGWVYADIGKELRIGGGRPAGNVAACHDLNLYLDLVNQLSEKCPFRKLAMQAAASHQQHRNSLLSYQ